MGRLRRYTFRSMPIQPSCHEICYYFVYSRRFYGTSDNTELWAETLYYLSLYFCFVTGRSETFVAILCRPRIVSYRSHNILQMSRKPTRPPNEPRIIRPTIGMF
jgi:hypothetical protein